MVISDARHRAGDTEAFFTLEPGLMTLGGRWTIESSVRLDHKLRQINVAPANSLTIDGSKIERLDSIGALLLLRTARAFNASGCHVANLDVPPHYKRLLATLNQRPEPSDRPLRASKSAAADRL